MILLYTHPFSIIPWRVRIALHEKEIEYKCIDTDLYTRGATPQFLEMNPFGQIPVIDHEGFVLAESIAILEYLEEKYPVPKLLPSNMELRATARKFMCWGTDYWPIAWKKWMAPRLPMAQNDSWSPEAIEEGRAEMCHHLDVLDRQLEDNEWLVGDYSLADVCYAPFVLVLDRVDLGEELNLRKNVLRWVGQLTARRSIVETMMPPSP